MWLGPVRERSILLRLCVYAHVSMYCMYGVYPYKLCRMQCTLVPTLHPQHAGIQVQRMQTRLMMLCHCRVIMRDAL